MRGNDFENKSPVGDIHIDGKTKIKWFGTVTIIKREKINDTCKLTFIQLFKSSTNNPIATPAISDIIITATANRYKEG